MFHFSAEAKTIIACKQTDRTGLFEQCEEVKLMKAMGESSRVYSLANKKLMTVPSGNLFTAESISLKDQISAEDLVLIPGQLLWASSSKFHQTLCRGIEAINKEVLDLKCGKVESRKVNRQLVYRLTQLPASTTFSPAYQSKK